MKIAINGNIIDTKDIYMIHKIYAQECDNVENFVEEVEYTKNIWDIITYCESASFIIESFNNKKIIVELKYNFENTKTKKDYCNTIKTINDKITEFREQIISVWLEDQSIIPQYNLKND